MSTLAKITWALGLISASLFVLLTGRTNVHNFEKVQASIEEIYEDRLVVKGLIFELASLLHRKEVAILTRDANFFTHLDPAVDDQIDERLEEFRATKLTQVEERTLERFEASVAALMAAEEELGLAADVDLSPEEEQGLLAQMAGLDEDLRALSKIQLSEGRRQMGVGDKAVDEMNRIHRIENYMLVAFAAMLLVLLFISPRKEGPA